MSQYTKVLKFKDSSLLKLALGPEQENLKTLSQVSFVRVQVQARHVKISADHPKDLEQALELIDYLVKRAEQGKGTQPRAVRYMAKTERPGRTVTTNVQPRSEGQREYLEAIRRNDLTFGLGVAGTGKTMLAVSEAVRALTNKKVSRLVLTRPAVEAGERLGFLPGTASEKVDPYLQPILDNLVKMLGKARVDDFRKNGVIEIAPLAFMRGRSLEDAFILLDEAQNCTFEQLMLLVTRIGEGSRCVVTGDESQVDLDRKVSGLGEMVDILSEVDGVGIVRLTSDDVQRHPLVAKIVNAVAARRGNIRGL